ncbi:MAG TPA: histidine kinase [Streptosporangiaceae bacterium]|nr:histidine kinase [Streptosporangiaceae bacterium]
MRMLRPAGYLANRAAGRWALDVLLTLLAWATAVAWASAPPDSYHIAHHPPGAAKIAVLALMVAPLVVRRIWPIPVFGVVVAACIVAVLWDRRLVDALALLIALYTVAELRPRRAALVCAGLLEFAMVVILVLTAGRAGWSNAIPYTGIITAALGLGLYSAARRAYLAELHERADRLERERDQQGALAAAAERARIAREMHDVVAHHLTVMVTLSEAAAAASASSPDRAAEVMRSVSATGRRALADTRRLLGVLRQRPGEDPAAALAPVPDLARLDALIEEVRAAGLATMLEVHGHPPDVPAGVQLTVYRLVQEALTNTLKHGGAGARATVRLRYLPGELRVDVDDDGAGAAAAAPAGVSGGLIGMQERVHAYGGEVRAGPGQPGGWNVSARLRLDGGEAG